MNPIATDPQLNALLQSWEASAARHFSRDLSVALAVGALVFGAIYLLFGWKVFRIVSSLQAGVVGAIVGAVIGSRFGASGAVAGALFVSLLFALTIWTAIKLITALMFGFAAAVIGLLASFGIFPFNILVAIICAVVVGLIAYRWFRPGVMVYTALNGAAMIVSAFEGLIVALDGRATEPHWYLSISCVLLLAAPGFWFQWTRYPARPIAIPALKPRTHRSHTVSRRKAA